MEDIPSRGHTRLAILVFALLLAGSAPSQTTRVSVAPIPSWVQPREWNLPVNRLLSASPEASRYLLFERQENAAESESFTRVVLLVENQSGVQDSGSLNFGFDPSYQDLRLHRVQIHRQGKVLDRLDRSKVKIIQPEPGLDGDVFTGRQSAVLFVEDLRVGDALEYAYTVRGSNPIFGGHFWTLFMVETGVPMERKRMRLVWPGTNQLKLRPYLTQIQPRQTTNNDVTDYVWDCDNLEPIPYEDDLPISYEPYPYIEVSDFEDWSQVVQWALPLYSLNSSNASPELASLVKGWEKAGASLEQKARQALDFVQDDLRYTGLELGPDSYRPADPEATLRLRYGDCKGKALLLCALLRQMGLQADPVLVNTSLREAVGRRLPSPFAFNHAIVRLELEDHIVWLDATRSHQGGSLLGRYLPPYGKGLVLRPGTLRLEDIPASVVGARQQVTSTFYLKDYKAPVRMTVNTTYYGADADSMRAYLARADAKEIAANYLNFYAAYYSGVRGVRPFEINDQRTRNALELKEEYEINDLWKKPKGSSQWQATFYPENLLKALTAPGTRLRKMPLGIPYPGQREQDIFVHLPDLDWSISPANQTVDHEAFSFHFRREFSGSTVRLHYECATKTSAIPPERVGDYLKRLEEMNDILGDTLSRPEIEAGATLARVNWLMVVVAAFGMMAAAGGGAWFWRAARQRTATAILALPPPLPELAHLTGLGGWLILVGFGLCTSLVSRPTLVASTWKGYFTTAAWQAAALPGGPQYHPLFGPLLIFELLGNIALLGLTALATCLFFAKSRIFPRVFIAMLVGNTLFLLVDELAGMIIPWIRDGSHHSNTAMALVRAIIASGIWWSYMLVSRRVKATFVR
jgi:hypothetical protein